MKKLNYIEIAALYIGIIMGAGFASGRECWQFFGVFNKDGFYGAMIVCLGFVLYGIMLTYIAKKKNTASLGALISPIKDKNVENLLGIILAIFYFFDLTVMSSAGGSLLNQQFGINKSIGGAVICVLVIITVLGDFKRISNVFRKLVPVLFTVAVVMIILVLLQNYDQSGATTYVPGRITPTWPVSAVVFLAYNTLAMITMAGNAALQSKDDNNAYLGAIIGGLCLGGLIIAQMSALLQDMAFTSSLDLPMLGYSKRISEPLNLIYGIVLFGSIYSTGSSCYFGFISIFSNIKVKKIVVIVGAIISFVLGMTGFTTLVEFLYPLQGYIGLFFLLLIFVNFLNVLKKNEKHN